MNFRRSRNLMWTGMILGLFLMSLTIANENPIFIVSGSIIFIISIIQAFIFYTCPDCHYSLMNIRGPIPDFCPKCGKCLKESDDIENMKGNDKQ